MKNGKKVLIGIGIVALLAVFWFIGTQNHLVSLKEEVNVQRAEVESALQRRSELIPNLVATVKGYAAHEEEVFTEIAEARSKLAGSISSGDVKAMNEASNALDSALSRLLVITEKYPELKASEQFIGLQDELAGTENRINIARNYWSEKVGEYNTTISSFPTSLIAEKLGYSRISYFEADEEAKKAPVVSFD